MRTQFPALSKFQSKSWLSCGTCQSERLHGGNYSHIQSSRLTSTPIRKEDIHAGIYGSCWYLRFMLYSIYTSCWYLHFMLVFTIHTGIYSSCWYLHFMLVFTIHAGIYGSCWYLRFMRRKYQHES